jgi:hypothetical protein
MAIVLLSSPVAEEATAGSTTRSIGAERPMETGPRQISMAVQLVGRPSPTAKRMRGNNLVNRAVDSRPARWTAAALAETTERAIDSPQAVRAEGIRVPSEVLPEAEVQHEPAVRAVAPAWVVAVAGAAAAGGAAAAEGEGK